MPQPTPIPHSRCPRATRALRAGGRVSLGVDSSGLVEYAVAGSHVYAFGPGEGPPRRVAPLRSPNRGAKSAAGAVAAGARPR